MFIERLEAQEVLAKEAAIIPLSSLFCTVIKICYTSTHFNKNLTTFGKTWVKLTSNRPFLF